MPTQPEALLEAELVAQLRGMGYGHVAIQDDASLLANLRAQLEAFNGTTFSERDMARILNHLQKGTLYDRSKILRDRFALEREDGSTFYVRFFDGGDPAANQWQVTQQVNRIGSYTNRYDVTLLCNGLPVVQVLLKRLKMATENKGAGEKKGLFAAIRVARCTRFPTADDACTRSRQPYPLFCTAGYGCPFPTSHTCSRSFC